MIAAQITSLNIICFRVREDHQGGGWSSECLQPLLAPRSLSERSPHRYSQEIGHADDQVSLHHQQADVHPTCGFTGKPRIQMRNISRGNAAS
ncbi:hypothetical protein [Shimazuella alba]|uniref:Uncharacterized protein n=1 Tax=Shimazuella alba TaxID=2690964 RepID=A0A6I4VS21_9BACL|nr:hypothetical protein [Shimazuella alba]MXQ54529.1 hypothetical protein [Shimazuella alba]